MPERECPECGEIISAEDGYELEKQQEYHHDNYHPDVEILEWLN